MRVMDVDRRVTGRRGGRRRRPRVPLPLVAVLGSLAALAAALIASPAARARADDFLRVFRTGRAEPLAIVAAPLPPVPGVDAASLARVVTVQVPAGREVAGHHEAQDRVDFNVRTLRRAQAPRVHFFVNEVGTISVNRVAAEQTLAAVAGPGLRLPPELDTPVQARIPAAVRSVWSEPGGDLTLWLTRNPRLFTTSGPSWEELRGSLIQLYQFLAPEAANRLRAVRNWDNTVVVLVPPGAATRRVRADGTDNALLVEQDGHATLVWQRYGIVHVLDGAMPGRALVSLANTLR